MDYTLLESQKQERDTRLLRMKQMYKDNIAFDVDQWIDANEALIQSALVISETSECVDSDVITARLLEHLGRGMDMLCEKIKVSTLNRLVRSNPSLRATFSRFFALCLGSEGVECGTSLPFHKKKGDAKKNTFLSFEVFKELNNKSVPGSSKWKVSHYKPNGKTKTMEWFQLEIKRKQGEGGKLDLKDDISDMWTSYLSEMKERAEKKGRFYKKKAFFKQNARFLEANAMETEETWNAYDRSWQLLLGLPAAIGEAKKDGPQKRKISDMETMAIGTEEME